MDSKHKLSNKILEKIINFSCKFRDFLLMFMLCIKIEQIIPIKAGLIIQLINPSIIDIKFKFIINITQLILPVSLCLFKI